MGKLSGKPVTPLYLKSSMLCIWAHPLSLSLTLICHMHILSLSLLLSHMYYRAIFLSSTHTLSLYYDTLSPRKVPKSAIYPICLCLIDTSSYTLFCLSLSLSISVLIFDTCIQTSNSIKSATFQIEKIKAYNYMP